ncbi:MAG: DNA polymerase IV [Pseudomonadota bacterium]
MDEESQSSSRKILHIDMDAFYASVEQRDNPQLRGRPLAVGGSAKRGVVAAASYEARRFGVRSAMPGAVARRRCPDLLFVSPRFDIYREVSRELHRIFARFTALIEPLSLDEAYLDVSADQAQVGSATETAQQIREAIRQELSLTASAGVSYNKFLAKIASDQNKPDGVFVIRPQDGPGFVATLPVRRFHGVGPRTAERMNELGIQTGADLRARSLDELEQHFGKMAMYLYRAARGRDDRSVKPDRERKSIGAERTYADDLHAEDELHKALAEIAETVWRRVEHSKARGRTVTLKLRYSDFRQVTRSLSDAKPIENETQLLHRGVALLGSLLPLQQGVRLLGLTLSKLAGAESHKVASDQGDESRSTTSGYRGGLSDRGSAGSGPVSENQTGQSTEVAEHIPVQASLLF